MSSNGNHQIPPIIQLQLQFPEPGHMAVRIDFANVAGGWATVAQALIQAYQAALRQAIAAEGQPEPPRVVTPNLSLPPGWDRRH